MKEKYLGTDEELNKLAMEFGFNDWRVALQSWREEEK